MDVLHFENNTLYSEIIEAVNNAIKKDNTLTNEIITELNKKYDAVLSIEVLEHILDPMPLHEAQIKLCDKIFKYGAKKGLEHLINTTNLDRMEKKIINKREERYETDESIELLKEHIIKKYVYFPYVDSEGNDINVIDFKGEFLNLRVRCSKGTYIRVLAEDIGDNDEAWTRFILLAQTGHLPAPTGADKTTLSLFMRADHPGALMEILTEFSVRGVNLTRIESRPTRKALGDYFFSVDCEGHVNDARVGEALAGLHRICADVRFLGSYPRHDGKQPLVRDGVTDADFRDAEQWLQQVRGR